MLAEEIKPHLTKKIIPFWKALRDDKFGGYYGYMDYDLKLDKKAVKGCILNSRIVWFFSNAYMLLRDESLLQEAEHGFAFMKAHCMDRENGGVFWSIRYNGEPEDTTKHTYNQAFSIYALSSYYNASGKEEALDMAKELGADYMLVSPAHAGYQADYEEIWSRMEKTIRELGEHAEKKEVKLVVETLTPYESNAFKSANDAAELFKRIDSPYVVGMCDLVPPYVQHESIMAYLDKLGDKMYHFHIIDGEQGTDSHIVPGEGSIPLKELFMELKEAGYQGTATLELVTGYINEPRLYARRAVSQVRAYMKEAGF